MLAGPGPPSIQGVLGGLMCWGSGVARGLQYTLGELMFPPKVALPGRLARICRLNG